jgi:hypothetical protein
MWTRIPIGHDAPIETFTDSDWASANDYVIAIAKLQVKITCQVGWLLGSHRDMNATNLGSAIYASSKNVKQFPIAIKFMVIWTNRKLGKAKRLVAAHIDNAFTKASICHEMLFQIYRSGNKKGTCSELRCDLHHTLQTFGNQ